MLWKGVAHPGGMIAEPVEQQLHSGVAHYAALGGGLVKDPCSLLVQTCHVEPQAYATELPSLLQARLTHLLQDLQSLSAGGSLKVHGATYQTTSTQTCQPAGKHR